MRPTSDRKIEGSKPFVVAFFFVFKQTKCLHEYLAIILCLFKKAKQFRKNWFLAGANTVFRFNKFACVLANWANALNHLVFSTFENSLFQFVFWYHNSYVNDF